MPTEFKIPELGENVSAGDVVRVLVKAGDSLEKDQPVLELETDKATIEVPSNVAGTVGEVRVKPGDKVKVGQVVLTLGDGGEAQADTRKAGGAAAAQEQPDRARAQKAKAGGQKEDAAKADETERSQVVPAEEGGAEAGRGAPTPAPAGSGTRAQPQPIGGPEDGGLSQAAVPGRVVDEPLAPEDEGVVPAQRPRGEVVDINRGGRGGQPAAPAEPAQSRPAAPAAPHVRRLARELGVDIAAVTGSGPQGRISTEDVQAYVRASLSGAARSGGAAPAGPAPVLPDFGRWGEVERKPLSNIRRKTAEHLSHAWQVIPHVTQHDRADITGVEALRKRYAAQAEKAGGKLTMTAIALKIVAGALQRFPQFNSSIDMERGELILKKAIHVGVAADTPRGLLVPVIRDVDRKGIIDLARELAQASEKARAGKLSLEDMQGAGFTITNLGGIGGTSFTPIVNWPEVAILGVSRSTWEPVWQPAGADEEGSFEPRLMLPLSLSYDHRVIDGADAARFLRWVCEAFEQPFVLAL